MPDGVFSRVAIIGLGLIGGSIAKALRAGGVYISAYDPDPKTLSEGLKLGVIDRQAASILDVVTDAELVILAMPVAGMQAVFNALKDLPETVVITDVGRVKQPIIDAAIAAFGSVPGQYVPAHPIAGSEKHGVGNANPDLFKQHKVILTPLPETDETAVEKVKLIWQGLGAEVTLMSVAHHDAVLAQTSHLPHLLAYALIDTLSLQGNSLDIFDYAAGGLRDFSRIAASDPTMWRDIFQTNRAPLLEILDQYLTNLDEMRTLIQEDRMDELFTVLERSKAARDHFSEVLKNRRTDPHQP